ncbi:MAG: DUF72 domain-containing protein [Myxococcales bacterium]|nr:DUF72 domain-containing protein [Myxococcales bacterium]
MQTLVGTSGYSYPKWKGRFYPKDLPAKKFLPFYASRFSTVEINNTFYRMPSAKLVQSWADEVPRGFIFAVKAPQRITHQKRLEECAEPLQSLFDAVAPLAGKLGPILFQLPPNFKKDLPRLQAFLAATPKRWRTAFEFRHESWLGDDTYDALRAAGAALCIADSEERSTPLVATAKWGYLRLRREDYDQSDIRKWAKRISAQPWDQLFVYFKHEDKAKGPAYASLFMSLLKRNM